MEDKGSEFVRCEVLRIENRVFLGKILSSSISYLLLTVWLNSIRATASVWIVWLLIVVQFALYFSIFISSYRRSKVLGLKNDLALILFVVLAVLGRLNGLEIVIIPAIVIAMTVLSVRTKRVSSEYEAMVQADTQTRDSRPTST